MQHWAKMDKYCDEALRISLVREVLKATNFYDIFDIVLSDEAGCKLECTLE